MSYLNDISNGIIKENPIFILGLSLCPVLAVTTTVENALGMGCATTFVLLCSNILISLIKDFVPSKIRIPAFIVVCATFSTITNLVVEAFLPDLHKSLGIFLPLIAVNCIILGRAESFASKNNVFRSILDAIGMGLGLIWALVLVASVRELLGSGKLYGYNIFPQAYIDSPMLVAVMAPGAFLSLGFVLCIINMLVAKNK